MDKHMIILDAVSVHLSVNIDDLRGNSHKWLVADARKLAIRLLTIHTNLNHSDQAKLLGLTRSSVSKAWKRTKDKLVFDKQFLNHYETLKHLVSHAIKT